MIHVRSIREQHIGNGAPVFVLTVCLERDLLPKDKRRRRLLRSVAVGLAFFRAVDAVEANAFSAMLDYLVGRVGVEPTAR